MLSSFSFIVQYQISSTEWMVFQFDETKSQYVATFFEWRNFAKCFLQGWYKVYPCFYCELENHFYSVDAI